MKHIAYALCFPVLLFLVSCQKNMPTASFTVDVTGYQVSCHNTSSKADSYSWDFGDKSYFSNEKDPVHTYAKGGDYTITLQAINSDGSDQASKYIHISQTGGGGTSGTFTTFICNAVKVVKMPLYDGNSKWDVDSDADLMVEILENKTVVYDPEGHYIQDVSKLPVSYSLRKQVTFKKNQEYTIRLYDYDNFSGNDYIGGVKFSSDVIFRDGIQSAIAINTEDIQLVLLGKMD